MPPRMMATRLWPCSRHVICAVPLRETVRRSPLVHAEILRDALADAGRIAAGCDPDGLVVGRDLRLCRRNEGGSKPAMVATVVYRRYV